MSSISLILADKDEFFSERFSRYILEHNSLFEIMTFTKCEYLKDYLCKSSSDILLIEKSFINDEVRAYFKNVLVIVLDDKDMDNDGEFCHISKYQKTEDIIKKITFRYAESIGDKSIISDDTGTAKIVSVYSPIGGSGKTTLALSIATSFAMRGKRVIYFNMEKFNSVATYLNTDNAEGLSDIFLKLKNNGASISFDIMKRILTDQSGLQFFSPPESAMEFNEMSNEEINTLIKELANVTDLDLLIIDLPTEFDENVIDVLKLSNNVVFVATGDAIGANKTSAFMKEVNIFPDLRIVYDKFIPVINKNESAGVSPDIQALFNEKSVVAAVPVIQSLSRCGTVSDLASLLEGYLTNVMVMI
jgi:cellulose biosynthesis protein BcsQ